LLTERIVYNGIRRAEELASETEKSNACRSDVPMLESRHRRFSLSKGLTGNRGGGKIRPL